MKVIIAYIAMLIFDAVVLGGSFYLYTERHYSVWVIFIAVLLSIGSDPKIYGIKDKQ